VDSAHGKDVRTTPIDQWTCEERLNDTGLLIVLPAFAMVLAAALAVAVTGRWHGVGPTAVITAVCVMIGTLRAFARNIAVIDRRSGTVRIATVGTPWRRRKIRALGEFDRVAVWERRTPVDAGYYASLYSIVLLGGKGPLPLFTTDDEREAASVRDEVALFLRFN